jgi:hypothetical protein
MNDAQLPPLSEALQRVKYAVRPDVIDFFRTLHGKLDQATTVDELKPIIEVLMLTLFDERH